VRWALTPEEVPPWEPGWGWRPLQDRPYPKVVARAVLGWGAYLGDNPDAQHLLEEARAELGPPPGRWEYPRLVVTQPPMALLWGSLFGAEWHNLPPAMSPLTGLLRVGKMAQYELKEKGLGVLQDAQSRTAQVILKVAPKIGLLDPFREEDTFLSYPGDPPPFLGPVALFPRLRLKKGRVEEVYPPLPLGESLKDWALAGLMVLALTEALKVAQERGKVEEALAPLEGLPLPQEPSAWVGLEYGKWGTASFPPEALLPRLRAFLEDVAKHGRLAPARLQEAILEWGLWGLVIPGPLRFTGPPSKGQPASALPALASPFHAALLELARKAQAGEVLACEYCGRSFVAERPRRARYCSPQCRALAKKARDRGAYRGAYGAGGGRIPPYYTEE